MRLSQKVLYVLDRSGRGHKFLTCVIERAGMTRCNLVATGIRARLPPVPGG